MKCSIILEAKFRQSWIVQDESVMDHPVLVPQDTMTSSKPTATVEIRPAVSVWPPRTLQAGSGILHAFRDKVRLPDSPGLHAAQLDIFVIFTESPGINMGRFHLGCSGTKIKHFFPTTVDTARRQAGFYRIVSDHSCGMTRNLIRERLSKIGATEYLKTKLHLMGW